MRLGELLDARRILVPLPARTIREATMQLARSLMDSGAVADPEKLEELLRSEWPEDVVVVRDRAFLPHFRTDAVRTLSLALGIAPRPICRANDPNRCARIVTLIVAPTAQAAEYLRAMAAIAQALSSDETLAALHDAPDAEAVLAIPDLQELAVPATVTVANVMSREVVAVRPEVPLAAAARVMLARGVRAVPVVGEQGEVLGMLTDGHLIKHMLPLAVSQMGTGQMKPARRKGRASPGGGKGEGPVRDVMDRSVLCLSEDQSVADAAALMLSKDVDRFPVTRDGTLVGFLTRSDIIRKLFGNE